MGDHRVKKEAMEMMDLFQVLPRLVVFDLDYTLWPFYCECYSKRSIPSLYPQAKGILHALKEKGVDIAIASRSPTPDIANTFLEKLGIKSMFVAQEILSSWTHKTDHFQMNFLCKHNMTSSCKSNTYAVGPTASSSDNMPHASGKQTSSSALPSDSSQDGIDKREKESSYSHVQLVGVVKLLCFLLWSGKSAHVSYLYIVFVL